MLLPKNVEELIDRILKTEGGYVNDPDDSGGPTNYGITLKTLQSWRHDPNLTADDVQKLTVDEAKKIYYARYVVQPGFELINSYRLQLLVVDMWINHGPKTTTKIIQTALRLTCDGIMGPKTFGYLLNGNSETFNAIIAERIRFYGRLVTNDPVKLKFLNGWLDRVADFIYDN